MRWSDETANHGDSGGLKRNGLCRLAVSLDKPGTLNQVAWRIAANRKFREQNEINTCVPPASRVISDFCGIACEISDGCVDLSERNPHIISVTG